MDIFDDDEDFDFLEEDEDLGADSVHAPPDVRVARAACSGECDDGRCRRPGVRRLLPRAQASHLPGYYHIYINLHTCSVISIS